jgi:hypothetical protein
MAKGTAWGYQSFTAGNDLKQLCESTGDKLACQSYIRGAVDMMSSLGNFSGSICVSGLVNLGQLQDVVENWLRDHPEKRHWTAAYIVETALKEKFPCD